MIKQIISSSILCLLIVSCGQTKNSRDSIAAGSEDAQTYAANRSSTKSLPSPVSNVPKPPRNPKNDKEYVRYIKHYLHVIKGKKAERLADRLMSLCRSNQKCMSEVKQYFPNGGAQKILTDLIKFKRANFKAKPMRQTIPATRSLQQTKKKNGECTKGLVRNGLLGSSTTMIGCVTAAFEGFLNPFADYGCAVGSALTIWGASDTVKACINENNPQ